MLLIWVQDPKEATRERIERLRRDGAVDGDDPGHDKGSLPPALKPALKPGRAAAAEARAQSLPATGSSRSVRDALLMKLSL